MDCETCGCSDGLHYSNCPDVPPPVDWQARALAAEAERDKLRALLEEAKDAFVRYQMDVDVEAPYKHRDMMRRIDAALRGKEQP